MQGNRRPGLKARKELENSKGGTVEEKMTEWGGYGGKRDAEWDEGG